MRRVARRGVTLHTDANAAEVESADRAYAASGTHREQLEMLLAGHPEGLTQYQCAELLGWNSRDNVNPRMQELREMGFVTQSGERRPTGLGGVAVVWRHIRYDQQTTEGDEVIKVASTGRTIIRRCTRTMPQPVALAPAERDLRRHEPKTKRRGAQSKKPVQQVRRDPAPKLTGDALQDYLDKKAGL